MHARMMTCIALSLAAHVAVFAWAGSMRPPVAVEGGRAIAPGSVVMAELVPPTEPEPLPSPRRTEIPVETPVTAAAEPPAPSEAEVAGAAAGVAAADGEAIPAGKGIPGVRLDLDYARAAWVARLVAQTRNYLKYAPKGFEKMVREALSRHPEIGGGTAKISLRSDPSGSVGVEILSNSPELKSALARVAWKEGPLPGRYRIPSTGVNVNVTLAGSTLSVGIEIL